MNNTSGKSKRAVIHMFAERCRRVFAVVLCVCLVMGGFPSAFLRALASDDLGEYCYELERISLSEALNTAISDGTVLSREPDFKGEYADDYNELFYADGTLYELKDLVIKKDRKRDKVLSLQVFARITDNIPLDAEYTFGGDEEFIFLITGRAQKETGVTIRLDNRRTDVITIFPPSGIFAEETSGEKGVKEKGIKTASPANASPSSASPTSASPSDASPSNASPSDADHTINGYIYDPVWLGGRSAVAFVTTADELGLSTDITLNEMMPYDIIRAYMDDILERSMLLKEGEYEEAEDLWNDLMDSWELIYEARDNNILNMSDDEYASLDAVTEEIYQNLLLAGYDPYAIMPLNDYTLEVMGSFTLSGTGWSATSSDGGEVHLTTSWNTTTVWGWSPGTVTLTRKSGLTTTTHKVTILDTFRVCVYVSTLDVSAAMLEILGIDPDTIDASHYFPAGIVYVSADYLTEEKKQAMLAARDIHSVPLITSEEDWAHLLNYLKEMDTSEGVFETGSKGNAGNNVYKYFEDAQEYIGYGNGSGNTALFYQTGGEGYSSAYSDVIYHFDLLFHTNTVTYIYGNNGIHDGQRADDGSTAIEAATYIRGVTIDEANPNFIIPDGYVFEGYYTDPNCTEHWDSSNRLISDMDIYIKLTEGVTVTVEKVDAQTEEPLENAQFLLCKIVAEETYDTEGNPVIDKDGNPVTEPCLYYYDFHEYTGWIADRDLATPRTTTGELGEFEIILAGFNEGDENFDRNFCYFLWEIKAPDGYESLAEPVFFTVTHNESDGTDVGHKEVNILWPTGGDMADVREDENGFNTLIYIKNKKITFPVDVFKYTANDIPLPGAEFVLSRTETVQVEGEEPEIKIFYGIFDETLKDDGNGGMITVYKLTGWSDESDYAVPLISGEDGYIRLDDISPDGYILTEIRAPDGYALSSDGIPFILDEEGFVNGETVIRVENEPSASLPETGGCGTLPFTFAGSLIMAGAVIIYLALSRGKAGAG